ncbi:hypothetical protein SLA2020_488980 [Shorea laevis]
MTLQVLRNSIVARASSSFTISALIFSKSLTKSDIEKRLSIPSQHLNSFPPVGNDFKAQFRAIDERDKSWTFKCSIRSKRLYPEPVVSEGWFDFVRSVNLQIGDKVEFYREEQASVSSFQDYSGRRLL